jgi:hypothetical protein
METLELSLVDSRCEVTITDTVVTAPEGASLLIQGCRFVRCDLLGLEHVDGTAVIDNEFSGCALPTWHSKVSILTRAASADEDAVTGRWPDPVPNNW